MSPNELPDHHHAVCAASSDPQGRITTMSSQQQTPGETPDGQEKRLVYSLVDEHSDLSFLDEFMPKTPVVPDALRPLFPDGCLVNEVDGLPVYAYRDEPPHFGSERAVEATPQEMDAWRAVWASMEEAQQAFRARLKKAQAAYEQATREALADLTEAMKPWGGIEAELTDRSGALASKLHEHREAAKKWMKEKEAREQDHLDTLHGPRTIVLYKPESLGSQRKADRIARVHLVTCRRRPKASGFVSSEAMGNDTGLRAGDAWYRLTHVEEWVRSAWGYNGKNLRVKFCSFCKPWKVFEEHVEDFPRPLYSDRMTPVLGPIVLTEIPDSWKTPEEN